MWTDTITYEQPIEEHIRLCLRLEHLFNQVNANIENTSEWGSRAAMRGIVEILNVIARPDLKSKFSKSIPIYQNYLEQWKNTPEIDQLHLQNLLDQLHGLNKLLYNSPIQLADELRNNEFIKQVRTHLSNPGGAPPFSTPSYHLWLQQDSGQRIQDLSQWFRSFDLLIKLVTLQLKVIRESAPSNTVEAHSGFYQQALDPKKTCQLVRITLPKRLNIYPEISVGKHRLCIRFLNPAANKAERASQVHDVIEFRLQCCHLQPSRQQPSEPPAEITQNKARKTTEKVVIIDEGLDETDTQAVSEAH